jgi:hypothetical protein
MVAMSTNGPGDDMAAILVANVQRPVSKSLSFQDGDLRLRPNADWGSEVFGEQALS